MLNGTLSNPKKPIQDNRSFFIPIKIASKTTQLTSPEAISNEHFYSLIYKEIVTKSLVLKHMAAATSALLFRSKSKSIGFHVNV